VGDVLTLRVRDVIAVTPASSILRLQLGGIPFRFRAGQAALLGLHGRQIRRPYSIASAPEEARAYDRIDFLIRSDPAGGFGIHLHGLAPDSRIDLEGPFGSFVLPEPIEEKRLLFVAGGTGIAPLRAMIHQTLATGWQGPLALVYSVRSADDFAYAAELRELAEGGRLDLTLTVTRQAGDAWTGPRGRIGLDLLAPRVVRSETLCFLCGPPSLLADVPRLLAELGVASAQIRMEEW
jgi:ferredoxin-NADP reductase